MQPSIQAKQLKTSQQIKEFYNWLFNDMTKNGADAVPGMIKIDFYHQRIGATSKDNPNGRKATAFCTSSHIFVDNTFEQPLPPFFNPQNISFHVFLYVDEWVYFEVKDFDFTKDFEGAKIAFPRRNKDGQIYTFVSIQNFFRIGIASNEQIPVNDSQAFKLVTKGKSTYKVFELSGGLFSIKRTDNHADISPDSVHGRGIIKAYKELD